MKFIDLDELDKSIKLLGKPTPSDVLSIIKKMYEELK